MKLISVLSKSEISAIRGSQQVTKRAIVLIPAQISRAVGTICDAGSKNPYVPRSRSSNV